MSHLAPDGLRDPAARPGPGTAHRTRPDPWLTAGGRVTDFVRPSYGCVGEIYVGSPGAIAGFTQPIVPSGSLNLACNVHRSRCSPGEANRGLGDEFMPGSRLSRLPPLWWGGLVLVVLAVAVWFVMPTTFGAAIALWLLLSVPVGIAVGHCSMNDDDR